MARHPIFLSIVIIAFFMACNNSGGTGSVSKSLPEVSTGQVSSITPTSANCSGEVTGEGGSAVSDRGIFFGRSANPSSTGSKQSAGSGSGVFLARLSGLESNTLYYYQSFATNEDGTSYGEEKSFTTLASAGNPEINLIIDNVSFDFDSISGFTQTVYEGGYTERVDIFALTADKDTLRLSLVDNVDDAGTLAIHAGKALSIDTSKTNPVFSTLLFRKSDGTVYRATSGSISVGEYKLPFFNANDAIFSGSVDVNADGIVITGTLTDIILDCTECGG